MFVEAMKEKEGRYLKLRVFFGYLKTREMGRG